MKPLPARHIMTGVFIASLLPFVTMELFHSWFYHVTDVAKYLLFHNIVEFFSITVSMSIFGVGWFTYDKSKDRHALFLSVAFLAIGLMDFMHTLGYAGMTPFITPNSANKSTQYWIAARFFSALAFLGSAFIYPEKPVRWLSKRILMTAVIAIILLVFTGITFFPSQMPATFIQGIGLTPFKKLSEYLIIGLLTLTTAVYWKRISRTGNRMFVYYLSAFILCIFSEFVFAIYKSVFDTYNVLGHLYKVVAFYLIYKGIFASSVNKPYEKLFDINKELRIQIVERKHAEKQLQDVLASLRRTVDTTIRVLGSTVNAIDPYTDGHQNRSADLASAIATEMGLSQDKIDTVRMASSIHDIGKLAIPEEISSKPGKLTDIEFTLIKEHARKGFEMLKDVESPWHLDEVVYQHHERMDGSGYPRNLKGEEILIEARILAVADVVEAMASHRPYRSALGIDAALDEIEKNRGTLYDSEVADACVRLFREKGFKFELVY